MERAVERDPSIELISAEIIEDENAEDPRESKDDIERENAHYASERGFDEFVSEE